MKAANSIISLFVLFLFTSAHEIPFQVNNKTIAWPIFQFYGKAKDQIQITVQLSEVAYCMYHVSKSPGFDQFQVSNNNEHIMHTARTGTDITFSFQCTQDSLYNTFFLIDSFNQNTNLFLFMKITYKKNGDLLLSNRIKITIILQILMNIMIFNQYESPSSFIYKPNYQFLRPVYQFTTTTMCKIKVYWRGPIASLKIFSPGQTNVLEEAVASVSLESQNFFQFDVNYIGTWNIRIQANFYCWSDHKRGIMNITNFSDNKCVNYCSGKPYPVVGLATGKTDICICDPSKGMYLWDKTTEKCIYEKKDVCGDNIKGQTEQCDNGNQTGCKTGCVFDPGFTCTGSDGSPSVCSSTFGDNIKASDEQCDNGLSTGCPKGCIPEANYYFIGSNGQSSQCFSLFSYYCFSPVTFIVFIGLLITK